MKPLLIIERACWRWGEGWGVGGGSEYVSPWSEFQIRSFRVLMRRPCLCQYYTHFYVVCGHFIYVVRRCFQGQYCRLETRLCRLSEFYPTMASL